VLRAEYNVFLETENSFDKEVIPPWPWQESIFARRWDLSEGSSCVRSSIGIFSTVI